MHYFIPWSPFVQITFDENYPECRELNKSLANDPNVQYAYYRGGSNRILRIHQMVTSLKKVCDKFLCH